MSCPEVRKSAWQQSLAKWLKSEHYCLSKTAIKAVLSEALLYQKGLWLLNTIKSLWTVSCRSCNAASNTVAFCIGDKARPHLRWPFCKTQWNRFVNTTEYCVSNAKLQVRLKKMFKGGIREQGYPIKVSQYMCFRHD